MTEPNTPGNPPPTPPAHSEPFVPKHSVRERESHENWDPDGPSRSELARFKGFIFIQIMFLGASPLSGGFNFKFWSMMDTALLTLSIGMSALAFVLETRQGRRFVFRAAALLYILGVLDMAINILTSGVVGWRGGIVPS